MCIKCAVRLISSWPSSGMSTCQSAILNWAKPDNKRKSQFISKLIFSAHLAMPSHRAFPPWRYLQIFWTWGSCSGAVSRSICPGSPPWLPGHHRLWKMPIRYWNIENPETVHIVKEIATQWQEPISPAERSSLAMPSAESLVGWKKEVTEAKWIVTVLTTITSALLQNGNMSWGKTWNSNLMSLSSFLVFLIRRTRFTVLWFSGMPAWASDNETWASI